MEIQCVRIVPAEGFRPEVWRDVPGLRREWARVEHRRQRACGRRASIPLRLARRRRKAKPGWRKKHKPFRRGSKPPDPAGGEEPPDAVDLGDDEAEVREQIQRRIGPSSKIDARGSTRFDDSSSGNTILRPRDFGSVGQVHDFSTVADRVRAALSVAPDGLHVPALAAACGLDIDRTKATVGALLVAREVTAAPRGGWMLAAPTRRCRRRSRSALHRRTLRRPRRAETFVVEWINGHAALELFADEKAARRFAATCALPWRVWKVADDGTWTMLRFRLAVGVRCPLPAGPPSVAGGAS